MQARFIHLHLHTEYAVSDGLVRVPTLVEACVAQQMPAVAITDICNLFALVKFYRAAINAGVKPIIGSDLFLGNGDEPKKPFLITVLCQNQIGYKNLLELISSGYLSGQENALPVISKETLFAKAEGLIVLASMHTDIGAAILNKDMQLAIKHVNTWQTHFPARFYLEIQRTGRAHESEYIHAAIKLSAANKIPVVATNDVRFLNKDDYEAHEARVCVYDGFILNDQTRPHNYSEQQYFRSQEEMLELFADIPEALGNTVEIAKRCNVELVLGKNFLPDFPVPAQMNVENYLEQEARTGLEQRLEFILNKELADFAEKKEIYYQRLERELKIINRMGFPGYFLIVADFIRWAKANGVPVGPGRGSGAGSLVAFSLKITDLDPIAHELLFERFLNPERISMPDFDIDFCMEGRDRVIEYVAKRYGRDAVAQIITFGTMAAKAVVRDVGRVLGHPYGFVDKIAKLIPFELGITLEKALRDEELLAKRYKDEDDVKTLIDLAMKLEGVTRNVGKHAGGVVIAPSLLTDFTPLYCEPDGSNLVTQFDKNDVEAVGLVKFDFLGLRTLTIINWTLQNIKDENIDITKIPLDDKKTFELLKSCATTAVFQLESRGMKDLIKRLQPDCFDDIVALVALFRPGPLQSGMVDDFIDRKHGRANVSYPHPDLEPILRPTYGVILYQEQVMQIAQVLAGYSLGDADILRRAMGKKKPEEMAKQRAVFMEGAVTRNIDRHVANSIFDLMEKFAGYGFNKSHSAAYALIAYQTAWLKTQYPAEFMAAVLSSDMDNTDKVVLFINEAEDLGLEIISPEINTSEYKFIVNETGQIVYGLGAIKGVGEAAIESILACRKAGLYKDLFDLCVRVDNRKVNKKVLEALVYSGSLDKIGPHRASIMASIQKALQAAEQAARTKANGQFDMFGLEFSEKKESYINVNKWHDDDRLRGEKNTLGFYLYGHPIQRYEYELGKFISAPISSLQTKSNKSIVVAGYVATLRTLQTKSGNRMAVLTLEDSSGRIDMTAFSDVYNEHRDLLASDTLIIVEGEVSLDGYSGEYRVRANKILNLDQAREAYAKSLNIKLTADNLSKDVLGRLSKSINPFRNGNCPICLCYRQQSAKANLVLGDEWRIKPNDKLLAKLENIFGFENVEMQYK